MQMSKESEVCCSVMQCIAVRCSVLQCVAVYFCMQMSKESGEVIKCVLKLQVSFRKRATDYRALLRKETYGKRPQKSPERSSTVFLSLLKCDTVRCSVL